MTPKEKAVLLVASMSFSKAKVADYETGQMVDVPGNIFAKQCALIAVDEIFQFMKMDDDYTETASNANSIWVNYFIEVKKEIEKL
jgi:hypothetical protein